LSRAETRRAAELQLELKQIEVEMNRLRVQRRDAQAELDSLVPTES
jgi:hypothetical protein